MSDSWPQLVDGLGLNGCCGLLVPTAPEQCGTMLASRGRKKGVEQLRYEEVGFAVLSDEQLTVLGRSGWPDDVS